MFGKIALSAVISAAALLAAGCATNRATPAQESAMHYRMGVSDMQMGNNVLALDEFNKAIEKNPDDPAAHFAAGLIYYYQKSYADSEREFKKTISLDSKFMDARNNLGRVYVELKQYEDALREFKKAAGDKEFSGRESSLVNLGGVYDLMGDHEKSAEAYREALLLRPEDSDAMAYLAEQYGKLDKSDEAIKYYSKSLEISPDNAKVRYDLGLLYYRLGMNVEAMACFQKVMELVPGTELAGKAEKNFQMLK